MKLFREREISRLSVSLSVSVCVYESVGVSECLCPSFSDGRDGRDGRDLNNDVYISGLFLNIRTASSQPKGLDVKAQHADRLFYSVLFRDLL